MFMMRGRGEIGRHSGLRSQRPRHESSSLSVRTKLTKTAYLGLFFYVYYCLILSNYFLYNQ